MCALGATYRPGGLRPFAIEPRQFLQPPPHLFGEGVSAWFRPLPLDDPCGGSLYILHGTLILAVWLN